MSENGYDLQAGALCLDFANTVEWHDSEQPDDLLGDYQKLIGWGKAAGVLGPGQAQKLLLITGEQPEKTAAAYARAVQLREAVYRLFSTFSNGEEIDGDDLQIINEALAISLSHLQIVAGEQNFNWGWRGSDADLDRVLWAVARSAGNLLTSEQLTRVSQCADDRGCGYLFIDTSRNHSRRWCSMKSCGNRAKARRHYQQEKKKE